ncbi:MAG: hypothetical protein U0790_17315 [Isosphaeraceae bacterium]
MPTEARGMAAGPRDGRLRSTGARVLAGVLALLIAGCQPGPGSGPVRQTGRLKVGGEARLASFDGSDVILDRIVGASPGKSGQRASRTGTTEKLKLPVGTTVLVEDIVGDDSHVVIKGGPSDGAHCWVECIRLEPLEQ